MLIRLTVQTLRRREVLKDIQHDMVNESEAALSVNNVDLLRSEFDIGFAVFIKHVVPVSIEISSSCRRIHEMHHAKYKLRTHTG